MDELTVSVRNSRIQIHRCSLQTITITVKSWETGCDVMYVTLRGPDWAKRFIIAGECDVQISLSN